MICGWCLAELKTKESKKSKKSEKKLEKENSFSFFAFSFDKEIKGENKRLLKIQNDKRKKEIEEKTNKSNDRRKKNNKTKWLNFKAKNLFQLCF